MAEHFYHPAHQRIFAAITRLTDRGQIADPVTLKSFFDQDGGLADIGGGAYLGRLAASVVTIINAGEYGRTIYDAFLRRQLIEIGSETVNDSYEHSIEIEARELIEGRREEAVRSRHHRQCRWRVPALPPGARHRGRFRRAGL